MQETLLDNGSEWKVIVAALLLFGALSHYPIHRLDRLRPILAHNQHPADGVSVEHSSNTASAGKESCGCFSPVLYRWQIVRYFPVCVCVRECVFTVTPEKFCLTPPRLRRKAPCTRCTSAREHPSGELHWIDVYCFQILPAH